MQVASARPILVVGGGPVGLVLGTLLSRAGTPAIVLERSTKLPDHPQAHFINCRTMEIFKHAFPPSLFASLRQEIPPLRYWRHFSFCTSVLGMEIGRVDHFSRSDPFQSRSPTTVAHLSQKRLMPPLLQEALSAGCEVRLGCEVTSFREDEEGVEVTVVQRQQGNDGVAATALPSLLAGSYLIAADGASSKMRQLMGVSLKGPTDLQHLMNIHFSSKALAQAIEDKPAMLYFVYNKDIVCVLVAHHFQTGEFVCQLPFFPPVQEAKDFSESACRDLVSRSIGQDLNDLNIHSIRPWTMHCQVAHRYRSRQGDSQRGGRAFLVGDAAHRFPPAGGFGMNTGIQDAHNLAWKLALVTQNQADESLLGSYEEERRPAAIHNAELSLVNFQRSLRVPNALGLDAEQPKELARVAPPGTPKSVFEGALALGRRPLASLESPGQPYGRRCLEAARQVLRDGAGLPLLFPETDLGTQYRSLLSSQQRQQGEGNGAVAMVLGKRLPHIRLRLKGAVGKDGGQWVSTVDLGEQWAVMRGPDTPPPAVLFYMASSSSSTSRPATGYLQAHRGVLLVELLLLQTPQEEERGGDCVTLGEALLGEEREAVLKEGRLIAAMQGEPGLRGDDAVVLYKELLQGSGLLTRPDGHVCAILPLRQGGLPPPQALAAMVVGKF